MSFGANVRDAFVDRAADSLINDIIPGDNRGLSGVVQTGVDQFANNEINRDLGGGLGSGGYGGGNFGGGGFGGGGYGGGNFGGGGFI